MPEPAAVELFRFPHAPGDPLESLLASATRNLERHGHLPWMVLGASEIERLAAVGAGQEPGRLAAVEGALLAEPDCAWTVLAGQQPLLSGAGWLTHAFVRQRRADGSWRAWVRPQTDTPQGIAWLGDWTLREGAALPDGDPLFPIPTGDPVRLARPAEPPPATWQQPLAADVGPEDLVAQLGDFACRWFGAEGGLPPMAVRWRTDRVEGLVLPATAVAAQLSDVAIRWAQQRETRGVGTCRRTHWPAGGRGAQQLQVVLEVRGGPALTWVRRYRVDDKKARWETPDGTTRFRPAAAPRAWLR